MTNKSKRLKVIMSYISNPLTTAVYIERALRKYNDVITFGPTITDDIIQGWNLEIIKDRIKEHHIPYFTENISDVIRLLGGVIPDLFFWVESGVWVSLKDIENLSCLSACYLIDSHLHFDMHLEFARKFDFVFIAHKPSLDKFKAGGLAKVFWIPLACDPEIHGRKTKEKFYDIGFVGSLIDPKRIALLNKLSQRFNVYYERCFLERMAEVFSQSKIVFNYHPESAFNMRVFEAMAAGSMLLTNEVKGDAEIFVDKKHLVIYRNEDELFELADYYLKNNEEREMIAEEGMREVLSKHTYEHRTKEMIDLLYSFPGKKNLL